MAVAACGSSTPKPGATGSGDGGASGGNSGSSGSAANGSNGGTGSNGGVSSSGSSGTTSSSSGSSGGSSGGGDGGSCSLSASNVRVTEIDVGIDYVYQEVDSNGGDTIGLAPLVISPVPSGGSRLAFMGSDGMVHIAQLDDSDQLVAGSVFGLPAFDFQDL